jgi:hypothetical protein
VPIASDCDSGLCRRLLLVWKDHIRDEGEKGHNLYVGFSGREEILLLLRFNKLFFSKSDGDQEIKNPRRARVRNQFASALAMSVFTCLRCSGVST